MLTAGLGGMGGAQPLADHHERGRGPDRGGGPGAHERRIEIGYVDVVDTLEEA